MSTGGSQSIKTSIEEIDRIIPIYSDEELDKLPDQLKEFLKFDVGNVITLVPSTFLNYDNLKKGLKSLEKAIEVEDYEDEIRVMDLPKQK